MFIVCDFFRGCFVNILSFFAEKKKFWTFWELFNKNIIRDTFLKNLPKLAVFEKIKLFPKKTSFFPKSPNFWTFSELLGTNTIVYAFQKISWIFAYWKKSEDFSEKTQILNIFEKSWVKAQIETDLISNLPNYLISKKNQAFFPKNPNCFSKKIQSLNFLRFFWAKKPFETHSKEI